MKLYLRKSKLYSLYRFDEGEFVTIGGMDFRILDKNFKVGDDEKGVLVISCKEATRRSFDSMNYNNWRESSLRKYLNEEFKSQIEGHENLLKFARDLTADDGTVDYWRCEDYVSLISCDEYRKYRKYLPSKENEIIWWTLTAYSTRKDLSGFVETIDSFGCVKRDMAFQSHLYVFPVLVFPQDMKVLPKR